MKPPARQPETASETPDSRSSRVRVLLPLPLGAPYDYLVPAGMEAPPPGMLVRVPLGPRQMVGVVWDADPDADDAVTDAGRLKPVLETVRELPALDAPMRRFVDWVARYYLRPPGDVLSIVLRRFSLLRPPRPRIVHRLTGVEPDRMTPARRRVLELAAEGPARTARDLAEIAGVGTSVVRGLVEKGALQAFEQMPSADRVPPDPEFAVPRLAADQARAADALRQGGLLRGGGRGPAPGPAGAGAAAGDRADTTDTGPFRRPVRRGSHRLAFRPVGSGPAQRHA